ncbi:MAG TPA: nuclear transport factor 2 family protein [Candidatus Limnocylindrales bacterium]|nr:nuclear transport factor 2 family protein [Candidatus Limnocylindrales bacterium]
MANVQDLYRRYANAIAQLDFATLESIIHRDFVLDYPQSGERFRGFASFRAQLENYPGGIPAAPAGDPTAKVVGDDDRWAMSPGYTVLPLAGPERFTSISRVPYPDGTRWWVVAILTVKDDQIVQSETYFAPEFDPPEWRKDMVEIVPRD